jgi:predicted transcriptional regulator
MRKDKAISFRVPEAVYTGIRALAEKNKVSISQLMKDAIASASWRVELERNREYHQQVLRELDRIERRLSKSKAGKTGVARKVKS